MKTSYLLPCSCGEKTQVDASESGRTIQCRCGASLVVPTLRGLARLEKVETAEPPAPARAWGGVQRGMAVGALIALLGIGMTIYWTVKPLPKPSDVFNDEELLRFQVRDLKPPTSPLETLRLWIRVDFEGLLAPPAIELERYHRALDVVAWWRILSYVVAAVGLVVLGISLAVFWVGRSQQPAPLAGAPTAT